PDAANGHWSLWLAQSLNFTSGLPTFSAPVLASEHHVKNGTIQTIIAGQCSSDRSMGDFIQLRIGPDGEANISYSETDSRQNGILSQGMFVRQNGGSSVLSAAPTVAGDPAPTNSVTDASLDATYEVGSHTGGNEPNLDITGASVTHPDTGHYRVTMNVADLRTLAPDPSTTNPDQT